MKPKARYGQIRFVHVIACEECDRRWKSAWSTYKSDYNSSKSGPFFDVLNNEYDTAVTFSLTERGRKHILSMN